MSKSIHKIPYRIFLCVFALQMIIICTYGQADRKVQKSNAKDGSNILYKEISGHITSFDVLLVNVNIIVKNTNRGTKTNNKGFYTINAKKGEVLLFTHIGMQSLEIIIEDITKVLNIKMRVKEDTLDEVIVKTDRKRKAGFTEMGKPRKITTARGTINTRKAGYKIQYINGEDLTKTAVSFSRLRGAIWDIDGVTYRSPPPIDWNSIEDVAIIRSLAGTVIYGSEGRHGVIIIRTKVATFSSINGKTKNKSYTNNKKYQEDALGYKELKFSQPQYLLALDTIYTSQHAYNMYQKMSSLHGGHPNFYLDVSEYFHKKHQSSFRSFDVLSEMQTAFANDPEALKALAYTYQKKGLYKKAVLIYKDIIHLRPNYAQSFRDLANAYVDLQEYQKAWRVYMNYLYRGNRLDDSGAIGQIIYHEMEALYIHKKDIANIREAFELNGEPNELSNDVRMVFEWNTSEAEFELEFVNPEKQSYTLEHSFFADKELISNEKLKGYSSKEFVIEDLTIGDWLVNLRYFGNKTQKPTYLKMTLYYNWGKTNQSQEITLFKLTENNLKLQLLKLNKKLLAYKYK